MQAVVAPPMDCPQISWIIGAAPTLLDEVMRGVGTGFAAEAANAVIAGDD